MGAGSASIHMGETRGAVRHAPLADCAERGPPSHSRANGRGEPLEGGQHSPSNHTNKNLPRPNCLRRQLRGTGRNVAKSSELLGGRHSFTNGILRTFPDDHRTFSPQISRTHARQTRGQTCSVLIANRRSRIPEKSHHLPAAHTGTLRSTPKSSDQAIACSGEIRSANHHASGRQ